MGENVSAGRRVGVWRVGVTDKERAPACVRRGRDALPRVRRRTSDRTFEGEKRRD